MDNSTYKKNFYFSKFNIKCKKLSRYLGPAFIVSVAYVDPGNFATNITAGSILNYNLLWVILWSNFMAIFLQIMSAKLGIATNHNLPDMCRRVFTKKTNIFLWLTAEISAIATTMAEFLGGALGFYLLFHMSIPLAAIMTAFVTLFITYMQKYGQRIVEIIITTLITVICIAYTLELILAKPDIYSIALHTAIPMLYGKDSILIASGMLGATVMPHVIFLHSQLVQTRNVGLDYEEKKKHLLMEKIDIAIAMNIAFIVNAAMVIVSAAVFYKRGIEVSTIEQAHDSLKPLLGSMSGTAFAIALLSSGFSSSAVGTMAGETVMDGFVDFKFNSLTKRLVTMAPALIILLCGVNPMKALVLSQVCLSFALPAAIIPLLIITSNKLIMGYFTNSLCVRACGWIITTLIIFLNSILIYSQLF